MMVGIEGDRANLNAEQVKDSLAYLKARAEGVVATGRAVVEAGKQVGTAFVRAVMEKPIELQPGQKIALSFAVDKGTDLGGLVVEAISPRTGEKLPGVKVTSLTTYTYEGRDYVKVEVEVKADVDVSEFRLLLDNHEVYSGKIATPPKVGTHQFETWKDHADFQKMSQLQRKQNGLPVDPRQYFYEAKVQKWEALIVTIEEMGGVDEMRLHQVGEAYHYLDEQAQAIRYAKSNPERTQYAEVYSSPKAKQILKLFRQCKRSLEKAGVSPKSYAESYYKSDSQMRIASAMVRPKIAHMGCALTAPGKEEVGKIANETFEGKLAEFNPMGKDEAAALRVRVAALEENTGTDPMISLANVGADIPQSLGDEPVATTVSTAKGTQVGGPKAKAPPSGATQPAKDPGQYLGDLVEIKVGGKKYNPAKHRKPIAIKAGSMVELVFKTPKNGFDPGGAVDLYIRFTNKSFARGRSKEAQWQIIGKREDGEGKARITIRFNQALNYSVTKGTPPITTTKFMKGNFRFAYQVGTQDGGGVYGGIFKMAKGKAKPTKAAKSVPRGNSSNKNRPKKAVPEKNEDFGNPADFN